MLVGGTVFDRGDVLRYAFGKGFRWSACGVLTSAFVHGLFGMLLVSGVVGDDWQHFFYALFRYSFLCRKLNFLTKCLKSVAIVK